MKLALAVVAVALTVTTVWASHGKVSVGMPYGGFPPSDTMAAILWVNANVRQSLERAQPVTHYQTEAVAESLAHWINAPRGSNWYHYRGYGAEYYGYHKFSNDTIRGVAFVDPATGNLLGAKISIDATLQETGDGTQPNPYTYGINLANPNTWTGLQKFDDEVWIGDPTPNPAYSFPSGVGRIRFGAGQTDRVTIRTDTTGATTVMLIEVIDDDADSLKIFSSGAAEIEADRVSVIKQVYSVTSQVSTYTALVTDDVILCNGTFTVTLYAVGSNGGRSITINNIGTGVITVEGAGSETIDGDLNQTLYTRESFGVFTEGTAWYIR